MQIAKKELFHIILEEIQSESFHEMISRISKILIEKLSKKYEILGSGRNRISFKINNDFILKVPLNDYGLEDNYYEEKLYKKYGRNGEIPYAACKIFHLKKLGIPLLKMEYVDINISYKNLPDWVKSVDGYQIGIAKDGKLVCYDFGRF